MLVMYLKYLFPEQKRFPEQFPEHTQIFQKMLGPSMDQTKNNRMKESLKAEISCWTKEENDFHQIQHSDHLIGLKEKVRTFGIPAMAELRDSAEYTSDLDDDCSIHEELLGLYPNIVIQAIE